MINLEYIKTYAGGAITVTQEQFNMFLDLATAELNAAAQGMSGVMRDEALCLLVCDRATMTMPGAGMVSEKVGADYSYTKESWRSQYRLQYLQLLEQYKAGSLARANSSQTHSDVASAGEYSFTSTR